ncbi:MAG TPA: branched-chain amino acid ABC transporter permease [Desulfurococcales archaeon]|nr:branched-chain amino acid ABC transporter permease [Desulfurococcales archaeon]
MGFQNTLYCKVLVLTCILLLLSIPLAGSSYLNFLACMALVYSIWALGYNLLLGYTGLLSFGHGAYFGLGAYTVAILTTRYSIQSLPVVLGTAILVSTFFGTIIGYLCARHVAKYFALLTLAFSQLFYALTFKLYKWTGGSDGIGVKPLKLLGLEFSGIGDTVSYYYLVLLFFLLSLYTSWRIVNSPFGKALQAIRDNPLKAESIGIPVKRYKWYAFIVSTVYSGLAGALYAPLFGHVVPDLFHFSFSGEVLFATLLGGHRIFIGPVIGAIVFTIARSYITAVTIYWPLVLGLLLVIVALFFPHGVIGTLYTTLKGRFRRL